MAALIMESAEIGTDYNESLAERLANGPLPVPYALLCATDVASTLRDLHQKGLAHGEVNLGSIRFGESGARLKPRGARTRFAEARSDVIAFGAVLYELMTGAKPPSDIHSVVVKRTAASDLADVRNDAIRIAAKCLGGEAEIRQVLIELRILGILARRISATPRQLPAAKKTSPTEPLLTRLSEKSAARVPEPEPMQGLEEAAAVLPDPQLPQGTHDPAEASAQPESGGALAGGSIQGESGQAEEASP